MNKILSYDIKASFLVPAYNLPQGVLSQYITTTHGQRGAGMNLQRISIDVWLIKASKEEPKKSMLESLQGEEQIYQTELTKTESDKSVDNAEKIRRLKAGKSVFAGLIEMSKHSEYVKQPDAQFLDIADRNLNYGTLRQFEPDIKNHLYLAALSRYEENQR